MHREGALSCPMLFLCSFEPFLIWSLNTKIIGLILLVILMVHMSPMYFNLVSNATALDFALVFMVLALVSKVLHWL
jgi:hypothetical protein